MTFSFSSVIGPIATIALLPLVSAAAPPQEKPVTDRPIVEMVFVLDTTGSMGGLLEGAKQRIWAVVNEVMSVPAARRPEVRVGLVAYRDNGDDYVTRITPLTSDLDRIYSTLMDYQAGGGGDTPENVRRALSEAVSKSGWAKRSVARTEGKKLAQIVFLVGDAPPHDDYVQEPDVLTSTAKAIHAGIYVNTIQCGNLAETTPIWQKIAARGEGKYFAIAQDGGIQSITTPFDVPLAKLGSNIGRTYMAFGGGASVSGGASYRASAARKVTEVEEKVSAFAGSAPTRAAAAADRAVNKAINVNAYDKADLVTAIENRTVTLDTVTPEDLPDDLKKLTPEQRKTEVEKRLQERKRIRAQILALSKKRNAYIAAESKKSAAKNGKATAFDTAVSAALKQEIRRSGIPL